MDRRSFLLAAAVPLTGCAALDHSLGSGTSTPTATPTATSTPTHPERFRTYLAEKGIEVETLARDGDTAALRYVTTSTSYDELSAEIGTVAGGYFREVQAGWDAKRLDALVRRDGSPVATWYAKAAWLRELENGDISSRELSLRVLETVERA